MTLLLSQLNCESSSQNNIDTWTQDSSLLEPRTLASSNMLNWQVLKRSKLLSMSMLPTQRLFISRPHLDQCNTHLPKEPRSLFKNAFKKRNRRMRDLKFTLSMDNTSSFLNQRLLNSLRTSFRQSVKLEATSTDLVTLKLKNCSTCITPSPFQFSKKLLSTDLNFSVKTELSELKLHRWYHPSWPKF